jgi:ribonuclease HII
MNQMHSIYPEYAFASHKGYATALHRRLLVEHGPCPLHRRSFAPVGLVLDADVEWEPELDWEDEALALELT